MMGKTVVKIEVGAEKEVFVVHKDLLCKKAPFFDKMFNGQFLEGHSQSAQLPEDDAITFKLFVAWIYHGIIEVPEGS